MAVKLRLTRMGRKKRPFYRIIAVDSRKKRDGSYIERLGYYHPLYDPPTVEIDAEKVMKWLRTGATPSDTVRSLLQKQGIWTRFKLEKQGLTTEQIEKTMTEWFAANSAKMIQKAEVKKDTPRVEAAPESPAEPEAAPEETPAEEPVETAAEENAEASTENADQSDDSTAVEEPAEEKAEEEKTEEN